MSSDDQGTGVFGETPDEGTPVFGETPPSQSPPVGPPTESTPATPPGPRGPMGPGLLVGLGIAALVVLAVIVGFIVR